MEKIKNSKYKSHRYELKQVAEWTMISSGKKMKTYGTVDLRVACEPVRPQFIGGKNPLLILVCV